MVDTTNDLKDLFEALEKVSKEKQKDVDFWYCHQQDLWSSNWTQGYKPLEEMLKDAIQGLTNYKLVKE